MVKKDSEGNTLSVDKNPTDAPKKVHRDLTEADGAPSTFKLADGTEEVVLSKTVTLESGVVISMAQILEAGSLFGDLFAQEDQAKIDALNEAPE